MSKGTHFWKWQADLLYDGIRAILNTDYRGLPSLEVNIDVEGRLEQLIKEVETASEDDPRFGADRVVELERKIAHAALEAHNAPFDEQPLEDAIDEYYEWHIGNSPDKVLAEQMQLVADILQETSK